MMSLVETDGMAIYMGVDQALFVLSDYRCCPRCGRPAMLFRHKNGRSQCLGCSGLYPDQNTDEVNTPILNPL